MISITAATGEGRGTICRLNAVPYLSIANPTANLISMIVLARFDHRQTVSIAQLAAVLFRAIVVGIIGTGRDGGPRSVQRRHPGSSPPPQPQQHNGKRRGRAQRNGECSYNSPLGRARPFGLLSLSCKCCGLYARCGRRCYACGAPD